MTKRLEDADPNHKGGPTRQPGEPSYEDFKSGKITKKAYLAHRRTYYAPPVPFNDERKLIFLREFATSGLVGASAIRAGVSDDTVRNHRDPKKAVYDPEFAEAYERAQSIFREGLVSEAYRRAVEGWLEPVYQKGECVGEVRRYSERLLEMLLKRFDPAFRDKAAVDVNVAQGGVLVVPSANQTPEEWQAAFNGPKPAIEAEFTEVTPVDSDDE